MPETIQAFFMAIRLAKYIAQNGYCSRKQASRLIEIGAVQVNNRAANHIDHIEPSDIVTIFGEVLPQLTKHHYFAFYKPIGIDCKLLQHDPTSLLHLLPKDIRLFPVGRLDKDSHGLILLTTDGDFYHQLNHPEHHQEKEYLVTVNKTLTAEFQNKMASGGIPIKDKLTQPCQVQIINEQQFKITLTQGLNRQIRRMAKYLGYYVTDLKRIRIAELLLTKLELKEGEMVEIDKDMLNKKP